MELINLQPIPSQSFSVPLGDNNYALRIYSTDGVMAYDLDINGENIINGFKLVNDVLLLPYRHQEINGNLLMSVAEDDAPDYTRFGTAQFLYYLTADETAEYRELTGL